MLTDMKTLLDIAEEKGCAIPAFNVYNAETALGAIFAAEEANSCVILQMYSRLFSNFEAQFMAPTILEAARKAKVKVAFHLDHGANERAHAVGVSVEGELGHIGVAKDGVSTEYTKVDEAKKFVEETGVDALAIMVGTAHGHYKQAPVLAIDRIAEIHAATKAALVLHGGSGVPDDQIQAAVKAGIRKINFGTDVCCAFLDEVRRPSPDRLAVDLFMKEPIQNVKRFCLSKIELLGAVGCNE